MKTFVTVLIALVVAFAQASAQKSKPDVYITGKISVSLNKSSQSKLFESESELVVVGCDQSPDMSISINRADLESRLAMIRELGVLNRDTSRADIVSGDISFGKYQAVKQFVRAEGKVYVTCVAVSALKYYQPHYIPTNIKCSSDTSCKAKRPE